MSKPIIGAHVSVSGGLYTCFDRAREIGVQAIQIFGASPRQWKVKQPDNKALSLFHEAQKNTGLGPVFLHAAYLVNLASPNEELWQKSIENLAAHFQIANSLHAAGLIFHLGSYKGWSRLEGLERLISGMKEVLARVPDGESFLIMENSSGGGDKIGGSLEDLAYLFHGINNPRVKICLDTQHAFASGAISIYTKESVDTFIKSCDELFGWKNVVALHINDSKTDAGSCTDRHENIGHGKIGLSGLKYFAGNKNTHNIPWLLEVPGFDNQGPDKENVKIVNDLF